MTEILPRGGRLRDSVPHVHTAQYLSRVFVSVKLAKQYRQERTRPRDGLAQRFMDSLFYLLGEIATNNNKTYKYVRSESVPVLLIIISPYTQPDFSLTSITMAEPPLPECG